MLNLLKLAECTVNEFDDHLLKDIVLPAFKNNVQFNLGPAKPDHDV